MPTASCRERRTTTLDGKGRLPATGQEASAPFRCGDLLAERFRVVHPLGAGGMGEVYEAYDLELKEHVAVKVVRPGVGGEAAALRTLRREAVLARRVTHPNVCRTFDVFRHAPGPADAHGGQRHVLVLSMELLPGETLAEHLHRCGPMTWSEALPVIRQMAAALDAAHAAGVVHQDLKCSNVLLVPGDGGTRAVVTDFGIAVLQEEGAQEGRGTPGYMAPEIVEGGSASAQSDLYSLAVVIHEMLTGRLPSAATGRPRGVLAALRNGFHADPAHRPQSAEAFVESLETAARRSEGGWRRWRRRGALMVLLLTLVLNGGSSSRPPQIAVLAVSDGGGPAPWYEPVLEELLAARIQVASQARVLPPERTRRVSRQFGFRGQLGRDGSLPSHLGAALEAQFVLVVRLSHRSPEAVVEADSRWIRLDTGDSLATYRTRFKPGEIRRVAGDVVQALGRALGWKVSGGLAGESLGLPQEPEALRLWGEAREELLGGRAASGVRLLRRAQKIDPHASRLHLSLVRALWDAGEQEAAVEAGESIAGSIADLPFEERLLARAALRRAAADPPDVVKVYDSLLEEFPGDLDYSLEKADALINAGEVDLALALLDRLATTDPWGRQDPRVDLAVAMAMDARGDTEASLQAARAAAVDARQLKAWWLLADAKFKEGYALRYLGRPREARSALTESRQRFEETGDWKSLAQVTRALGMCELDFGHFQDAEALFRQALALSSEIGDRGGRVWAMNNLAVLLGLLQRHREAAEQFREVIRELAEMAIQPGLLIAQSNRARSLIELGELDEAEQTGDEVLLAARLQKKPQIEAMALEVLGRVELARGELDGAERRFREALEIYRHSDPLGTASVILYLAEVRLERGDVDAARSWLAENEDQESSEWVNERVMRRLLHARIALAAGDVQGAEGYVSTARTLAEAQGIPRGALGMAEIEARIDLARGEPRRAIDLLEKTLATPWAEEELPATLRGQVVWAEALLAAGEPRRALELSEKTASAAERIGMRSTESAARSLQVAAREAVRRDDPSAEPRRTRG